MKLPRIIRRALMSPADRFRDECAESVAPGMPGDNAEARHARQREREARLAARRHRESEARADQCHKALVAYQTGRAGR